MYSPPNTLTINELLSHYSQKASSFSLNMDSVASIILGGGEGTRLHPLTLTRCKPAINFGGKFRLIDIPLSYSIHANCGKIFVLTQFLSSSLHKHIFQTYKQFNHIEILTAEQRPSAKAWYQGTADAVRQNLDSLLETHAEYFLILSGDQLYHFDFREMVSFAKETQADVLVASLLVGESEASRMGVLKTNSDQLITDFYEKPTDPDILKQFRHQSNHSTNKYLCSMGIYLFKRQALIDLLTKDRREDFGKHLIPLAVESKKATAFIFKGYWEDIGTIETFYHANLNLNSLHSPINFYDEAWPIFSCPQPLPPARFYNADVRQSIICDGSVIDAKQVTNSILGPRTIIQKGSIIQDSYLMGNDYYASKAIDQMKLPPHPHVGENCIISGCIIDKNAVVGKNVRLINAQKLTHYDGSNIFIRDGIIIVPRGATIPDGFVL